MILHPGAAPHVPQHHHPNNRHDEEVLLGGPDGSIQLYSLSGTTYVYRNVCGECLALRHKVI